MSDAAFVTSHDMVTSTTTGQGYLSGPGFTDVPVRYNVVDGRAIFNGCIDMGTVEEVEMRAAAVQAALSAEAAASTDVGIAVPDMAGIGVPTDSSFLWTNAVVPFVIDGGLPNQQRVTDAIAHFHANTQIRFVARTTQANYVRFISNGNLNFSSSPIGMRGGEQIIRISNGATTGTVIHECCHSLGILHEQSRCDRDQFVTINYANIQSGFESNFDKFCAGFRDYFEYDYGSIMHYPGNAFSMNGQATIVALRGGVTLGQRNELSYGDRLTIAEMYSRFAERGHTGVFRAKPGGYALWVNASWASFEQKWQQWANQGLRLIDINVRQVGNELRYSGTWSAGSGPYGLWVDANLQSFTQKWQQWSAQGMRLVDLHVRRVGGQNRYSGVWTAGGGGHALWVDASWQSFQQKWQEWANQGLRLVDINVTSVAGQPRYSGVWLAGSGGYGLWANAPWSSFVAKWQQWSAQGLRLADINVHRVGNDTRYSGVFLPGTEAYYLWANTTWESFRAKWQQLAASGIKLVDYEFTEPAAAADTADLSGIDVAGLPAVLVPASDGAFGDGAGRGGLHGTASASATTSPLLTTADGSGGIDIDLTTTPATTNETDGVGGLVVEPAASASQADSADGVGGSGGLDGTTPPEDGDIAHTAVGEALLTNGVGGLDSMLARSG